MAHYAGRHRTAARDTHTRDGDARDTQAADTHTRETHTPRHAHEDARTTTVRRVAGLHPIPHATNDERALVDASAASVEGAQRVVRRGFAAMARRPVVSVGLAAAVIGATAAGYTSAGSIDAKLTALTMSPSSLAMKADAADQAELHQAVNNTRSKASVNIAANAATATEAAAAAEAAKQAEAARQVEADRAARDAQRQALVANAKNDPRSVARAMLGDYGWSDSQFSCLSSLWTKESNWSSTAQNSSSGAYGIPQALPGSKMATVAADWRTNPVTQITWGLQYIRSTYGTPCSAWSHSQATNWY